MKFKSKIGKRRIVVLLMLAIQNIAGFAYDFLLDGIYYTIISEEDLTVEVSYNYGTYYSGDVVIPSQVSKYGNTYTVKRIGENAFLDSERLHSVTIPETVDSIHYGAFVWCTGLTNIEVNGNNPYFQSIDGVVFNKAITKLLHFPNAKGGDYIIPDGVKSISTYAFTTNKVLRSVLMPSTLTHIENHAFGICDNLYDVQLSSSLEYIGDDAFSSCPLDNISLPEGLKYIGNAPFSFTNLKEIYIPKSVEYIGETSAIGYNPSLEKIDVAPDNKYYTSIDGILYDKALTRVLVCPSNIDYRIVTLPSSITKINTCAFHTVIPLTKIVIPSGVSQIGDGAFYYCSNLSQVVCYAQTPPSTPKKESSSGDPWEYSSRSSATLYVPKGCAKAYKDYSTYDIYHRTIEPYAVFKEIVEMDDETGMSSYTQDYNIEISRYNISGRKIKSTTKGLSIIRMKDHTTKKVIK